MSYTVHVAGISPFPLLPVSNTTILQSTLLLVPANGTIAWTKMQWLRHEKQDSIILLLSKPTGYYEHSLYPQKINVEYFWVQDYQIGT